MEAREQSAASTLVPAQPRIRNVVALTSAWNYEIMPVKRRKLSKSVEIYTPKDALIPARLGGGVLKESVTRELPSKKVISYALAYVNPAIYAGDNGRVLGYDNKHGFSHRHFMGQVTAEAFLGYAELYERFERDWQQIAIKFVNGE